MHKECFHFNRRTLTIGGSFTTQRVYSFTSLDSTASLHSNNNIFWVMAKSILVKLETSHTVILHPNGECSLLQQSRPPIEILPKSAVPYTLAKKFCSTGPSTRKAARTGARPKVTHYVSFYFPLCHSFDGAHRFGVFCVRSDRFQPGPVS